MHWAALVKKAHEIEPTHWGNLRGNFVREGCFLAPKSPLAVSSCPSWKGKFLSVKLVSIISKARLVVACIVALTIAPAAHAQISDQQAIDYVKTTWELTDLTRLSLLTPDFDYFRG